MHVHPSIPSSTRPSLPLQLQLQVLATLLPHAHCTTSFHLSNSQVFTFQLTSPHLSCSHSLHEPLNFWALTWTAYGTISFDQELRMLST
ncbi:hypothetical protein M758_12G101700 [Ceratodon purpureus]|nr:hypothetical protein M758_12G101700 [Ceratodon purpureus]